MYNSKVTKYVDIVSLVVTCHENIVELVYFFLICTESILQTLVDCHVYILYMYSIQIKCLHTHHIIAGYLHFIYNLHIYFILN